MKILSLVVACAVFVSGCASMFHGTKDTIYVRSNEPDTVFYANNREIGRGTNAIATIEKKRLDETKLRAEKAGCTEKSTPIETSFDATTLLGILIDYGIISILLIDWGINGAVVRAEQTEFVLTPECTKPSQKLIQPVEPAPAPAPVTAPEPAPAPAQEASPPSR